MLTRCNNVRNSTQLKRASVHHTGGSCICAFDWMTLNWKTTYFLVLGVNVWQTVWRLHFGIINCGWVDQLQQLPLLVLSAITGLKLMLTAATTSPACPGLQRLTAEHRWTSHGCRPRVYLRGLFVNDEVVSCRSSCSAFVRRCRSVAANDT